MIRKCNCGRAYTQETWQDLKDPKKWWVEPGVMAEQRLCFCGSHISVEVPMVLIVGIEKGRFRVCAGHRIETADLTAKALAEVMTELGFSPKEHYLMRSSSMDFPEDDGAPDVDTHEILQHALKLLTVKT